MERVAHDYLRNQAKVPGLFAVQGMAIGDTGLTVEEVADRLDIPPGEWDRLVHQGEAPGVDTHEPQPRWYAMTVAAYEMVDSE